MLSRQEKKCLQKLKMKVEIITPEKSIFNGEATSVSLPGTNGIFQVLDNHAPIISSLKSGEIIIEVKDASKYENIESRKVSDNKIGLVIKGGIVELVKNKLVVLAN
jgi:F-type H+-transporting ATPase subunit epsilon